MKSVLVIGGGSHLGKRIINKFATVSPIWRVYNVDHTPNQQAYANFEFDSDFSKINTSKMCSKVIRKHDCIINATSSYSKCELKNNKIVQFLQQMNDRDVHSSLTAAYLAKKYLKEEGLLVLMGSDNRLNKSHSNLIVDNISKENVSYLTELLIKNPLELPTKTKLITLLV